MEDVFLVGLSSMKSAGAMIPWTTSMIMTHCLGICSEGLMTCLFLRGG